ncbi:N-acetyltransferase [Sphingomonas sp. KR1UV-12]|uniref:N-acetyltransferase n=1 Tax=Sphingomonas aurea TaxID=3063994 RepID=A0ABT9EJX8_9SPHN|nr:N-acetyltransferase [Sphingomonas sp. KR1UV-12]MDP1027280.1 N-acetyltransferase [Sphingomonas sp. KR1UV-12]
MTIAIRPAGADHVAAIDALLRSCFPRGEEADLVRNLCIAGDMVLVLAAIDEDEGAVVGTVAFSRMAVEIGGRSIPAVALAPIAVASTHRHQGVAEALVHAGIEQLETAGIILCFVLGDPGYYTRFGFAADVASGFSSPYAGEYLMALPLQGGLIPCGVRGNASHAAAFAMLSAK